nr:immunoglobulin heavy chain junction region [Macaca mulatta]
CARDVRGSGTDYW